MPNIWKQNQDVNEHPNRNVFDLSFDNHLTMKFGYLYPVLCKEVVPGDSFHIFTEFGLKFMPLVFPVQSRMRAHVHFFYVPNRLLWKNFKNAVSGLEEHVHPYIEQPSSFFKTGSLADYLDIPTTVLGDHIRVVVGSGKTFGYSTARVGSRRDSSQLGNSTSVLVEQEGIYPLSTSREVIASLVTGSIRYAVFSEVVGGSLSSDSFVSYFFDQKLDLLNVSSPVFKFECFGDVLPSEAYLSFCRMPSGIPFSPAVGNNVNLRDNPTTILNSDFTVSYCCRGSLSRSSGESTFVRFEASDASVFENILNDVRYFQNTGRYEFYLMLSFDRDNTSFPPAFSRPSVKAQGNFSGRFSYVSDVLVPSASETTPFSSDVSDENGRIRLNALPFRAYECIYNAYYRNTQNQPFVVQEPDPDNPGEYRYVEKFNQWITTDADGADTTDYHLFRRNYELDFLTSAMPSPQFGAAPLVGMSALGEMTLSDPNGLTSTFKAELDGEDRIVGLTATSPIASLDHARAAMNLSIASVGMSINDFRSTNAFQRFLETTLRKGYRYIDFVTGHFGQAPKHLELDMPEFIGGVSHEVSVNMVTNMSAGQSIDGNNVPLGEFAGTANCFGKSHYPVNRYFDDFGYVIGIMSVVPTPAYSQLLPKHFLKTGQLDYYFPEFSQLGLQPITYREVAPLTAYQDYLIDEDKKLTDTFGYQRPYYDLVGNTDQVHGDFRVSLKDFLIHRIFATRPELGSDFLEIKPEEVNDIFAYRDINADNIIGQLRFTISAKRPVPRITIPGLGR